MGKIMLVGIGPGDYSDMTLKVFSVLKEADLIVGYTGYVKLLGDEFKDKKLLSTGMRSEVERCRICFEHALAGENVALICSGDSGVYGMASLVYQLSEEYDRVEIETFCGVSACISGAALLGAPINHDFCTISLSDLLTPWEVIEKRLLAAAEGDFVICLYNPSSHKREDYLKRACDILLKILPEDTACGYVRNIGRDETSIFVGSLSALREEKVDMFTTCFIGNQSTYIHEKKLITPRGYKK